MRIKEGSPRVSRPSLDEMNNFSNLAKNHFKKTEDIFLNEVKQNDFYQNALSFLKDKHFVIAGGTGRGLGYFLSQFILSFLSEKGSLSIISRDLSRSFEFETGNCLKEAAANKNLKFYLSNSGVSLNGRDFDLLIEKLNEFKAKSIIYINCVAAASSGMLPDYPQVYVKDIDEEGLFQWKLPYLSEEAIKKTSSIMGDMAVSFVTSLENAGIQMDLAVFSDWRGSLDESSRDPKSSSYGLWGAYSTSLHLPKKIIQKAVLEAYYNQKPWINIFYPTMGTRALSLIPGGVLMRRIYLHLAKLYSIDLPTIPQLALKAFCIMKDRLNGLENPFPRLDSSEASLDLWAHALSKKIDDNPKSPFYYSKWISK